jgi:hypothetical protein
MTRLTREIPTTLTLGADLAVGRPGYGAMQLTGPKGLGTVPRSRPGGRAPAFGRRRRRDVHRHRRSYGPHSNEELIREALDPYHDDLVIATKGGFALRSPRNDRAKAPRTSPRMTRQLLSARVVSGGYLEVLQSHRGRHDVTSSWRRASGNSSLCRSAIAAFLIVHG